MNRRRFIHQTGFAAACTYLNTLPLKDLERRDLVRVTILHTNDVHSRIDPFPEDGSRNAGQGGVARRAALLERIRSKEKNVLLLDAGDIFQGTPYFNLYNGELEIKLMTDLRYDAATIGNHDFDAGIENLSQQLVHSSFPMVSSNYRFTETPLESTVKKYLTWDFDDVRIGMYALDIELDGLVPQELYGNTVYQDPIKTAQYYERLLVDDLNCDYVICLSHLGYRYRGDKVSDVVIAESTSSTDLIIGGHTHTFMDEPHITTNRAGVPVIINQAGWAGILLGRVDITFEKRSKKRRLSGG
ncbi:MAG: metallophosphatase, partial [Bacteroidota bacterium]